MNDIDFEQELYNHFGQVKDFTLGMRIGQYFYELGCRRTAEKYDEIEYNRQRAEENVPNDLEEAAEKSSTQYYQDACYSPFPNVETAAHKSGFIAGAKWQKERYHFFNKAWTDNMQAELDRNYENGKKDMKEQMMRDTVEGLFQNTPFPTICLDDCKDYNFKDNQKVRIIIVNEEENGKSD